MFITLHVFAPFVAVTALLLTLVGNYCYAEYKHTRQIVALLLALAGPVAVLIWLWLLISALP